MITIDDLPRDANGITQGAWRLVHADPTFAGGLGTVHMADGVSTSPVCGRQLRAIVAEYGGKLFLEPWGPLPQHFALPELVSATVSDEQLAKLPRAPWRDVAAEACMPLTLELIRLGGEGAPADFAAALAEIPALDRRAAASCRAIYIDRATSLRAEGYVEIPAALEGAIAQLDAIIASEPPTAPSEPSEPSTDGLPPVLAASEPPKAETSAAETPAADQAPSSEHTPEQPKPKGRRLPRS